MSEDLLSAANIEVVREKSGYLSDAFARSEVADAFDSASRAGEEDQANRSANGESEERDEVVVRQPSERSARVDAVDVARGLSEGVMSRQISRAFGHSELEDVANRENEVRRDIEMECLTALEIFTSLPSDADDHFVVETEEAAVRCGLIAEYLFDTHALNLNSGLSIPTAVSRPLLVTSSITAADAVEWDGQEMMEATQATHVTQVPQQQEDLQLQENLQRQLESEKKKIEDATKQLELFQQQATAAVREVENEMKQKISVGWQQLDQQRRMVEEEAKRLEVERLRIDREKAFRLETIAHESQCRQMEEQAWSALWEERRRHEKESLSLQQEVKHYRTEHERLSTEAAEGRSSIIFKQQEMRRRYLEAEVRRLETEVAQTDMRNREEALELGIELPDASVTRMTGMPYPMPGEELYTNNSPHRSTPQTLSRMADHLVGLEAQGLQLVIEMERSRLQRGVQHPCPSAVSWRNKPSHRSTTPSSRKPRPPRFSTSPQRKPLMYSPRSPLTPSPTPPLGSVFQSPHIAAEVESLKCQVASLSHRLDKQTMSPSVSRATASPTRISRSPESRVGSIGRHEIKTAGASVTMPVALARSLAAASGSGDISF
ncbi:hypothetical protein DIPPA_51462 [Diplonema papillatum]|nr:hypothetical protein DIPPA_51462 [Diplonema papillatum]